MVEKFYSLSEKGRDSYPLIRDSITVWDYIPSFQKDCETFDDIDSCWEQKCLALGSVIEYVNEKRTLVSK